MTNMVERVVAVLTQLPIRDLADPGGELDRLRLREAARAAIAAVRDEFSAAFDRLDPENTKYTNHHVKDAWRAVFDQALEDGR